MAKASKLPSGNWRVNLYLGKDADGKKIRRSITGKTKREAEQNAARYMLENHLDDTPMTVGDAVDKYILDASNALSPATIRGYRAIQRNFITGISPFMADRVRREDLQAWVNSLSRKYSPKTVKNSYGLVRSAIRSVRPNFYPQVKLPTPDAKEVRLPSEADIQRMLEEAGPELRLAIMLGAFAGLRRGEICYLRHRDVKGGCVSIHGDTVKDEKEGWRDKGHAKTQKSNRVIRIPEMVAVAIGEGEDDARVINRTPDWITDRFGALMKKLGMPYHFHALRHYFASVLIAQGLPKAYVQALGGWEDGGAIDKVYTHILQSSESEYSARVSDYFSTRFS